MRVERILQYFKGCKTPKMELQKKPHNHLIMRLLLLLPKPDSNQRPPEEPPTSIIK